MRSRHHHRHANIHEWHQDQRNQRKRERWIPYSLRLHGSAIKRTTPQIILSGITATLICAACHFTGGPSAHSGILFPVFGFVVGLAITFRMQSSYSRWWEGRTAWDRLSSFTRSYARTIWLHVPDSAPDVDMLKQKTSTIRCLHTLAVALKHHLRGERNWDECADLKALLFSVPNYNYDAANHPLTLTLHLSSDLETVRRNTPIDTQVLTHLLANLEGITSVISTCERLLRTPIPLGYNIVISRIVWIFILALPTQLWKELKWWTVPVTLLTAYTLFALAEIGLEIENPWGEGPNDLDLDRYCNLLALDLEEIMAHPRGQDLESPGLSLLVEE